MIDRICNRKTGLRFGIAAEEVLVGVLLQADRDLIGANFLYGDCTVCNAILIGRYGRIVVGHGSDFHDVRDIVGNTDRLILPFCRVLRNLIRIVAVIGREGNGIGRDLVDGKLVRCAIDRCSVLRIGYIEVTAAVDIDVTGRFLAVDGDMIALFIHIRNIICGVFKRRKTAGIDHLHRQMRSGKVLVCIDGRRIEAQQN